MKTFVILLLSIIAFAYTSEPEGSSEKDDSDTTEDEKLLQEMAGWVAYFHEGKDPCPSNSYFLSRCVNCNCVGDKSAECGRGPDCFVPERPLHLKTPCELGKKFCIGPIHCVCHSTDNFLVTCDGNNYTTCIYHHRKN
ncbi:uncharacterized protein LOC117170247 [Belonocnema kinseyi]|uniref:uncharacterized protein LOC117170247 n=1 Tax=Belonocnema kinseyi TaxID=2817044 RepID=UPI00143CD0F3|nr:uncharacterized protein LOC117170247 [Belonocnema kinseyi]